MGARSTVKAKVQCPVCVAAGTKLANGQFQPFSVSGIRTHYRSKHPEALDDWDANKEEYVTRFACDDEGRLLQGGSQDESFLDEDPPEPEPEPEPEDDESEYEIEELESDDESERDPVPEPDPDPEPDEPEPDEPDDPPEPEESEESDGLISGFLGDVRQGFLDQGWTDD